MDLFSRQAPQSFGTFHGTASESSSLAGAIDNPLSLQFVGPVLSKPKELLRYLVACQVRYLKTSIVQEGKLNTGILLAHCKLLLKRYTPEFIVRSTLYAASIAYHPFSWKFVEEHAMPEVLARCPSLQTTAYQKATATKKRSGHR